MVLHCGKGHVVAVTSRAVPWNRHSLVRNFGTMLKDPLNIRKGEALMRRVLPVIFASVCLVGYAVADAHRDKLADQPQMLSAASPIAVDVITQ